jgi:hypothetical protein
MRGLDLRATERERLIELQREARSALCRSQAKIVLDDDSGGEGRGSLPLRPLVAQEPNDERS